MKNHSAAGPWLPANGENIAEKLPIGAGDRENLERPRFPWHVVARDADAAGVAIGTDVARFPAGRLAETRVRIAEMNVAEHGVQPQ